MNEDEKDLFITAPNGAVLHIENPRRRKRGKPPAPIADVRVSADGQHKTGRKGVAEHITWHFADTGKFHQLSDIMTKVRPEGDISKKAFETTLGVMKRSRKVGIEMRPGAYGNNLYRFSTRVERLISLDEIEQKFEPVIADLLKQAQLPVSHQSSGRFRAAAAQLKKLLDDWAG